MYIERISYTTKCSKYVSCIWNNDHHIHFNNRDLISTKPNKFNHILKFPRKEMHNNDFPLSSSIVRPPSIFTRHGRRRVIEDGILHSAHILLSGVANITIHNIFMSLKGSLARRASAVCCVVTAVVSRRCK